MNTPDDDMLARQRTLWLIGLILALGLWAWWLGSRPLDLPPRIPHHTVEPWMTEALPGIGPRTAASMAANIRAGLPIKPARAASVAAEVFVGP